MEQYQQEKIIKNMKKHIYILIAFLFLSFQSDAQIIGKKISEETEMTLGSLSGTEYVRIAKSGYNYKVSFTTLSAWIGSSVTGTVTAFSSGNLSPIFTTSVATSTSTPALSFSLTNAAAHTFLGNSTGSTGAPSYTLLDTADIVSFTDIVNSLIGISAGTVTSVSSGDLSPLFTTSVATSTSTPAISYALSTASAHTFYGNATGSTTTPSFSAIDTTDIASFSVKARSLFSANSPATYSSGIIGVDTTTGDPHLATQYFVNTILEPIEITRAQAATHDAANGGNGDWVEGRTYRITDPAAPLYYVILKAEKDKTGNTRLGKRGDAYTTGTPTVHVEVGYDVLTNTIGYIYDQEGNNRIAHTSSYNVFDFNAPATTNNNDFSNLTLTLPNYSKINNNVGRNVYILTSNSEISGNSFEGISSATITGTVYSDSYIKYSSFVASNINVSSDSKITGCNFKNISVTGAGLTLANCTFIGNGEALTLPTGYSATGKTFISGVSSNFEHELDLTDIAIWDPTGSASGAGLLTIPANFQWIGKFITNAGAFIVIDELDMPTPYIPEVAFECVPTDGAFSINIYARNTLTNNQVTTSVVGDAMGGVPTFDIYNDIKGRAVIERVGNFNILSSKSVSTF